MSLTIPTPRRSPDSCLYRFGSNAVFCNADYLKTRVRKAVAAQKTPVEWVVFDASSINVFDVTGLRKLDELREEMAAAGVSVYYARVKRHLERFFNDCFAQERRKQAKKYRFQTLKPAINTYLKYQRAKGLIAADPESGDAAWREPVEPPRMGNRGVVPAPTENEEPREPGQGPDG